MPRTIEWGLANPLLQNVFLFATNHPLFLQIVCTLCSSKSAGSMPGQNNNGAKQSESGGRGRPVDILVETFDRMYMSLAKYRKEAR